MTLLTPKQAADKIGVSLSLVYAVLRSGKLKALRVGCHGRGVWRITEEAFEDWLATCKPSEEKPPVEDGGLKYL